MSQLQSFGHYYATQADLATLAAARLTEEAEQLTDPDVRAISHAAADRHRAEAALWAQLADEISTFLATTGPDDMELPL